MPDRAAPSRPGRDLTLSGFVAASIVAAVLVGATYWLSVQETRAQRWISQTHEALEAIAVARADLLEIQNGPRGFAITGREQDLVPYANALAMLDSHFLRLQMLTAENPRQQERLRELQRAVQPRLASAAAIVEARRQGGTEAATAIIDTGVPRQQMDRIRSLLQALEEEESAQLAIRLAEHEQRLRVFWAGIGALLLGLIALLAVIYWQLRRQRQLQQELLASGELAEAKARLQELSTRLISAQEDERRHIARELHDETGQSLTLIRLQLADLARRGAMAPEESAECVRLVDRAAAHIRALSLSLRPPMLDDLGLVDALEWVLEQQSKAAGWSAHLDADGVGDRYPQEVETACFRIGQEALTNAARYAQATEVKVSVKQVGQTLELTVADNGRGFDLARYRTPEERKKHFGLVSMEERAGLAGGRLEIDTAPGRGTRLRATFPVPA